MVKFVEKLGTIYKLSIGDYWYVGQTYQRFSTRYKQHKKGCFNKCKKAYWTKKYLTIRQQGVKKDTWDKIVKYELLMENVRPEELNYYEMKFIDKGCPFNMNTLGHKVGDTVIIQPLIKKGTLTEEQKKENYCKSQKKSIKVRKTNQTRLNNMKKYYGEELFCECCQKKLKRSSLHKHKKSITHLTNEMEWIE